MDYLDLTMLFSAISNTAGNQTAGKMNVMPGTFCCLSLLLLLSLGVQQLCYHFKVLLQTVNFRIFWGWPWLGFLVWHEFI